MSFESAHLLIERKAAEEASRAAKERRAAALRRARPGDSMASLMLGTLSFTVGLVTLSGTVAAFLGIPWEPWNEIRYVMFLSASSPKGFVTFLSPTPYCVAVMFSGIALSLAGIAVGCYRRRLPVLCAAGLVFCLTGLYGGAVYEIIENLIH
jgi:hypothetical protein